MVDRVDMRKTHATTDMGNGIKYEEDTYNDRLEQWERHVIYKELLLPLVCVPFASQSPLSQPMDDKSPSLSPARG